MLIVGSGQRYTSSTVRVKLTDTVWHTVYWFVISKHACWVRHILPAVCHPKPLVIQLSAVSCQLLLLLFILLLLSFKLHKSVFAVLLLLLVSEWSVICPFQSWCCSPKQINSFRVDTAVKAESDVTADDECDSSWHSCNLKSCRYWLANSACPRIPLALYHTNYVRSANAAFSCCNYSCSHSCCCPTARVITSRRQTTPPPPQSPTASAVLCNPWVRAA